MRYFVCSYRTMYLFIFLKERNLKSLREKYIKIKQTLRDRAFCFSRDAKKTGGGPPKKEPPPLSEAMQELAVLLTTSTLGLPAVVGDSDYTTANKSALEYACHKITAPTDQTEYISLEDIIVDDVTFCLNSEDENSNVIVVDASDKSNKTLLTGEATFNCQVGDSKTTKNQNAESPLSVKGPEGDESWERVNPSKLKKTINPLLQCRRRKMDRGEIQSKLSEEKQKHAESKYNMEMEILEGEKKRYQFEHEKAALDLKRAKIECEKAEYDRERSAIELERSKLALEHEKEINRIRMASLMSGLNPVPLLTAAAKKEYKLN